MRIAGFAAAYFIAVFAVGFGIIRVTLVVFMLAPVVAASWLRARGRV